MRAALASRPHFPPGGCPPQVSGDGDVWGDCVVPTAAAVLEGATNVVLDGVRHSMARIGSFDERAADDHVWYGSEQVGGRPRRATHAANVPLPAAVSSLSAGWVVPAYLDSASIILGTPA